MKQCDCGEMFNPNDLEDVNRHARCFNFPDF